MDKTQEYIEVSITIEMILEKKSGDVCYYTAKVPCDRGGSHA